MNNQSYKTDIISASPKTSGPEVTFINPNWYRPENSGFCIGHASALGETAYASFLKIKGVYDELVTDPYCAHKSRTRGFCKIVSCSDGETFQHQLLPLDQRHCQSENPEFENQSRELPALPLAEHFHEDVYGIVDAALRKCGLQHEPRPIQTKVHLQRLFATKEHPAMASPPQPHKDNAKFLYVAVLGKYNVAAVNNTLYDNNLSPIVEFELSPMEFFCLDDRRFYHHVDTVEVLSHCSEGYRDSLILEMLPL